MNARANGETRQETHATHSDMNADTRRRLADRLSQILADAYVLYANIQGLHWNAVGPQFFAIHKMTEEQYQAMVEELDSIAERIRAIGFFAPTTLSRYVEMAQLHELSTDGNADSLDLSQQLAEDHQTLANELRKTAQDAADRGDLFTSDLLTGHAGAHEKAAWMLQALASGS